jgi:hypothetical protein
VALPASWVRFVTATGGEWPPSTRPQIESPRNVLEDGARTVFDNKYLREHVSLGYAVTVHSAQGATADTTHTVLGENTTRSLLYVAMTRGRHTNTAYLYERTIGDSELRPPRTRRHPRHVARDQSRRRRHRRAVLANHDPTPVTAHDYAAQNTRRSVTRPRPITAQPSNNSRTPFDKQSMRPGAPKQRTTHSP